MEDDSLFAQYLTGQQSTPTTLSSLRINPEEAFRDKQGASTVLGQLYRAQWDDWKARFQPRINQLSALATDPGYAARQGAQAGLAVNVSYDNAAKGLQMQQAALGANVSQAQQLAQNRKLSLGRAADSVSAFNEAQISTRDLQDQILAGGMGLKNIPNTGQMQQG